jgi:exonuclease III
MLNTRYSKTTETCWIEIIRPRTKSMFICSSYRPPHLPLSKFIEELNKDLAENQKNAEIVLLGDFNVDYKQRSTDRSHELTRSNKL